MSKRWTSRSEEESVSHRGGNMIEATERHVRRCHGKTHHLPQLIFYTSKRHKIMKILSEITFSPSA